MNITLPKKHETASNNQKGSSYFAILRSWLFTWELYLILGIAGFLRLYRINTTEFDDDQASVFAMARNAVQHGHLVATSNVASIHIYNPPATIYFFMLPAALSPDPVGGAVLVALLATASVLLTYIFVRRYYGRMAAIIAALTYATATLPVVYSRFIWNQNLLPLFTMLFILTLFWGVVDRRKGWLFPALPLLGLLIQLHASGVFMTAPLLAALLLSPGTIRWRDLSFGILVLFILYLPYLLWEVSMKFIDVHLLLITMHQRSITDDKAWLFYQSFIRPYDVPQASYTLLSHLAPSISWLTGVMTFLLFAGGAAALVLALWPWGKHFNQPKTPLPVLGHGMRYLKLLRNSPYRCGLLVLLTWQFAFLALSHHSTPIYAHYFIIFMPGPFIVVGFFLGKIVEWLQLARIPEGMRFIRFGVYALALLIITAQLVGSAAKVVDLARGNYNDGTINSSLYNDLRSIRAAVTEADEVAQQHHLNRVYIATTWHTQAALRYLSTQMRIPVTLFTDAKCAVLPGAAEGSAVMLVGPYSSLVDSLVTHFSTATLIDMPKRSGSAPFRLYIVTPPVVQPVVGKSFAQYLQLLNEPARMLNANNTSWIVTRWSLMRSAQPAYRTLYGYNVAQSFDGSNKLGTDNQCVFTAMRAGDQLLFALKQGSNRPSAVTVQAQVYDVKPYDLKYGPLSFETYYDTMSPWTVMTTPEGKNSITIPL